MVGGGGEGEVEMMGCVGRGLGGLFWADGRELEVGRFGLIAGGWSLELGIFFIFGHVYEVASGAGSIMFGKP